MTKKTPTRTKKAGKRLSYSGWVVVWANGHVTFTVWRKKREASGYAIGAKAARVVHIQCTEIKPNRKAKTVGWPVPAAPKGKR